MKTAMLMLCNKIQNTENEIPLGRWNVELLNVQPGDMEFCIKVNTEI